MKNKKDKNKETIVVALGGNALGNTPSEQIEAVKITSKSIVDLIEAGKRVVVSHGNGPQVGMISLAFNEGNKANKKVPEMPLSLAGAMSQGYIGLHLQQAIKNELNIRNISKEVVSIVTQTLVDENDKSFSNPTKPIGNFYSEEDAKKLAAANNWSVGEDSGRGWRRMVPSPQPIDIVEKEVIKKLVEDDVIVIAGGGGGIPSLIKGKSMSDIDAVIDKDFTSEKLAELINADLFFIVTAEDGIWKDFGKPTGYKIDKISYSKLDEMISSGEFPEGSMKPKVVAVATFVKNTGKKAVITSLELTAKALKGEAGTIIEK